MRNITKIILHCSASDQKNQTAELINVWHKKRGFAKIGYHYFIRADGQVEKGRDLEEIGAHCEGENAHSIGICLSGLISFNEAQFVALEALLTKLQPLYPGATIHGHREFPSAIAQGKTCPVFDIERFKQPKVVVQGVKQTWKLTDLLDLLRKIFQLFSKRP